MKKSLTSSRGQSAKTKEKLKAHCKQHNIPLSEEGEKRSIRGIVQKLLDSQGVLLWRLGACDIAEDATAEKIVQKAKDKWDLEALIGIHTQVVYRPDTYP